MGSGQHAQKAVSVEQSWIAKLHRRPPIQSPPIESYSALNGEVFGGVQFDRAETAWCMLKEAGAVRCSELAPILTQAIVSASVFVLTIRHGCLPDVS
jgi:hypothetical protein